MRVWSVSWKRQRKRAAQPPLKLVPSRGWGLREGDCFVVSRFASRCIVSLTLSCRHLNVAAIQFLDDASKALFGSLGGVLAVFVRGAHSGRRSQERQLTLHVSLHAFPLGPELIHGPQNTGPPPPARLRFARFRFAGRERRYAPATRRGRACFHRTSKINQNNQLALRCAEAHLTAASKQCSRGNIRIWRMK